MPLLCVMDSPSFVVNDTVGLAPPPLLYITSITSPSVRIPSLRRKNKLNIKDENTMPIMAPTKAKMPKKTVKKFCLNQLFIGVFPTFA